MADFRTFRGVVAELQVALGAEASEMEILELAHLLVYRPELPDLRRSCMGSSPKHEMPIRCAGAASVEVVKRNGWARTPTTGQSVEH